MQKIIIFICLFSAVENCAMHTIAKNVAAGLLATAPVTIPGTYYYQKTNQEQDKVRQESIIRKEKIAHNKMQLANHEQVEILKGLNGNMKERIKNQEELEMQVEKLEMEEADSFRSFVKGAVCGATPGINLCFIGVAGLIILPVQWLTDFNGWANDEKSETILSSVIKNNKNEFAGFVSGLSLNATVPLALLLSVLKKVR